MSVPRVLVVLIIAFLCCIAIGSAQEDGNQQRRHRRNRGRRNNAGGGATQATESGMATLRVVGHASQYEDSQTGPYDGENTAEGEEGDQDYELDEDGRPINCSRCFVREAAKFMRLETIKDQILSKLRLRNPPNITGKQLPRIPALTRLIDQFDMQGDGTFMHRDAGYVRNAEPEDYHARVEKVVTFASPIPPELPITDEDVCYFSFQPEVTQAKVIRARFYVYVKSGTDVNTQSNILFMLYKLGELGPEGIRRRQRVAQRRIPIYRSDGGAWHHFNVHTIVSDWLKEPSTNFGLQLEVFDYTGRSLAVTLPLTEDDEQFKPLLFLSVQDQGQYRTKRGNFNLQCDEDSDEERCCRFPLVVDFTTFGWDWVIAPKRYHANYCSGECPYVFFQKYPHTHLIRASQKGSIGPCCTPAGVSPISLLYFDNHDNIIYGELPGMVINRCGCA